MKLHVAFLWHMHQPLYLDPRRGRFMMPWVRLHGVRAYHDMLTSIEGSPGARATFNLVPSLMAQIRAYLAGNTDDFLEVSRIPSDSLDPSSCDFLLNHFFSCHWPTMVDPYPRYAQLLDLRGRDFRPVNAAEVRRRFSPQDFLDLQVWFNLTWVGFTGRRDPLIQALLRKGRLFSEDEKKALLAFHMTLLEKVIPRYEGLWQDGSIDITVTPFYHPILPLLIDSDMGARPRPGTPLPPRFSYPDDALSQLRMARKYAEEEFGRSPTGLWPSEGSVAPELMPLVADAGFRWAASDESVLMSSLDTPSSESLFQPYRFPAGGKSVDLVFRHHELADLIGFVYKGNDPRVAVGDFVGRLREMAGRLSAMDRPPLVTIALDGENPWEYYPDGGEAFLKGLYDAILGEKGLELVTISDYLTAHPPTKALGRLYSASWINNDFSIWIGGEEENRAWKLLGEARDAIDRFKKVHPDDPRWQKALDSVFVAEGSDWFWWYGDKFSSDYAYEFDELFRLNLQQVYLSLGHPVPGSLLVPIRRPRPALPAAQPVAFIHPQIDGRLSFYWEWAGAGVIPLGDLGEAMYRGEEGLSEIAWGFDTDWLYIRIMAREPLRAWRGEETFVLGLASPAFRVAVELIPGNAAQDSAWRCQVRKDGQVAEVHETGIRFAVDDVAEVAIPFALLSAGVHETISVSLESEVAGLVKDRWPRGGVIMVHVPDRDFEKKLWLV